MSSVLFLIDKTLGKYKVLEHIGHGGMAEVYKGQQQNLDRMVAVKVLHPFLADEEGFVVRFQREARIVATLRHPNIVQVYDFDYHEELSIYYMIMEFIEGDTLKLLLNNGQMSSEKVMQVGFAIADALDYAHQRGMVHRDIKPANIMFTSEGQPILTDFGIAKMLTLSGLTASGAMVGTPAYMAPEVGMGKSGTAASDIYSLGVVLYQMLAGRLPFESESPMGMVMQHINEQPTPPSQFSSTYAPGLEAIILRSMAKVPEDRFASAGEMAAALRKAMGLDTPHSATGITGPLATGTNSIPAAPPDQGENTPLLRTWPPNSPHTATTIPPVAVAPATPPTATGAEEPQKRSRQGWKWLLLFILTIVAFVSGWLSFGGPIPPEVRARLAALPFEVPGLDLEDGEPGATVTPAPTATPAFVVVGGTATPAPTTPPTASPTATQPPVSCTPRVKLDEVRIEPDPVVAPGTSVIVYVTLSNNGACAWATPLMLYFVSGEQMGAPEVVTIRSLQPNEKAQIILPMKPPEELGVYESRWEVRQPDGDTFNRSISVKIEVGDLPAPTATLEVTDVEEPAPPPLELETPELLSWQIDPVTGDWSGTLQLEGVGGVGSYRYYLGEVSAETQIPNGRLEFRWTRCDDFPLQIWVLSGESLLRWEGEIAYPAPEECR